MFKENASGFNYSPGNPPSLDELRSRIFAVHSTNFFPENGILKAGAINIGYRKKWNDEPPSFRPTLHFALGEVVRGHMDFTWDENSFAVVAPLGSLEDQLVNLFTHDTFILGDLTLSEDIKLMVPKGTDTSKLPDCVQPLEYNPKTGLRKAVDQYIRSQDGWPIKMREQSVSVGSVAYINNTEINNAAFFDNYFEAFPYLSYGSHANSERGEAYKFGITDQAINIAMKTYSEYWLRFGTDHIKFYRSLILHNIETLEEALPSWGLNSAATKAFLDKKKRLFGWINILDADLLIREEFGKSFSGAPGVIQKNVRKLRNDPDRLKEFSRGLAPALPDKNEDDNVSPAVLGEILHAYPAGELEKILELNPQIISSELLPEFRTKYAVQRWILVNESVAQQEDLATTVMDNLSLMEKGSYEGRYYSLWNTPVLSDLKDYLTTHSNRLSRALEILGTPPIRQFLTYHYGFKFPETEPLTLEDFLRAYPETKIIFTPPKLKFKKVEKEAFELLRTLDKTKIGSRKGKRQALTNLNAAFSYAFEVERRAERLKEDVQTVLRPINSSKWYEEMLIGSFLDFYQVMQRDKKLEEIWGKFGLAKEFRQIFPEDKYFWETSYSFLEIKDLLEFIKFNPEAFEAVTLINPS